MFEPTLFEHQQENSLRDVSFVLFRHKRKILVFFATVMFMVTLGTFLASEMYESTSKLMIRLGRESVTLDPMATTGQTIGVHQNRQQEINSELEILRSRELVETVVDYIGVSAFLDGPDDNMFNQPTPLGTSNASSGGDRGSLREASETSGRDMPVSASINEMRRRDRAISTLTKNLNIEASRESNIITISYVAPSPRMAQAVISKLTEAFLDKHIEAHYSEGSFDFFSEQTNKLRGILVQTEEDLMQVKNDTGIASLAEQRTIALNRMGLLKQEIERNDASLAASRARIAALESTLQSTPPTREAEQTSGFANTALDNMRARLYELQLQEQDLLSRYTDRNEQVQEIRRQITEAENLLEREMPERTQVRNAVNEAYQQTELNLLDERANFESIQANVLALRSLLKDVAEEVREINDNEARITGLEREREIQEDNYRRYSENLEQARIDHAMQMEKLSNISIVQAATSPMKPVRPKKMMNLALGIILGLAGGIGFAFTSEYVDHTLKRPEDIEKRLQLPVLVSIGDYQSPRAQLSAKNGKSTALARRAAQ